MFKVLVVDDDLELVEVVKELLERNRYEVITAYSGKEAVDKYLLNPDIKLALVDLVMPLMDGFELIEKLKEINESINIIMITGQGTVPAAVEAIKRGAKDFIIKPYDKDLLLNKMDFIRKSLELQEEVTELKQAISQKYGFNQIMTRSPAMKGVFDKALSASQTDANVFIIGETGTGKGLLARGIHLRSERADQPFVSINCGSIPRELLESELFGHKKGSFTGAVSDKEGLFVSAKKGTIFLDEIGEMPKELQVRILKVLEDHRVRPVGETREIEVNARVIAAANRPVDELKNSCLREDLFFRLAVIVIELPALKDRKDDIPLLANHFIKNFNEKYSKSIKGISQGALESLIGYDFPGNIRELENLVESIIAIAPSDKSTISEKDIKSHLIWKDEKASKKYSELSLEKIEKFTISQALRESEGNKSKAAKLLGISRDTLYRKLKQLGLE